MHSGSAGKQDSGGKQDAAGNQGSGGKQDNEHPFRVGILGLGTVAAGVLEVLERNAAALERRLGRPIVVTRTASRTPKPELQQLGAVFSTDLSTVADAADVDLVVELIGGEERADEIVRQALAAGKHVVTANKAIVAQHGDEYLALARANNVAIAFEAAVAGGIPVLNALTHGLVANRVSWLAGIINGTSNYILTAMAEQGQSFADALAEAQRLGYAEADPTFDVGGIDAGHKLAILAGLAFGIGFRFEDVHVEGIDALSGEDIEYARQLGYRIKHLGIARATETGTELRVHPTLVPEQQLLASVDGVMNAVVISGNAAGDTLYYGAGAGALPTASAVVADIVDVAMGSASAWLPAPAASDAPAVVSMAEVESAFYLKIPSLDKPGVFARAATVLSEHDISIEAAIQKEQAIHAEGTATWVPIIILTQRVREGVMEHAMEALAALPDVVGPIERIRVEHFAEPAP